MHDYKGQIRIIVSGWDLGKVSTREGLLPPQGHTHYVLNVVCGASWAIYINWPRQLASVLWA